MGPFLKFYWFLLLLERSGYLGGGRRRERHHEWRAVTCGSCMSDRGERGKLRLRSRGLISVGFHEAQTRGSRTSWKELEIN